MSHAAYPFTLSSSLYFPILPPPPGWQLNLPPWGVKISVVQLESCAHFAENFRLLHVCLQVQFPITYCAPFLFLSLPLLISSFRCSPPSQKQDYQKIYSHWCNEFEKYKSAMKQWQAKQEVSVGERASIKFEFNNSWRSVVLWAGAGGVATLAAAAVNCFNEFPMQIA